MTDLAVSTKLDSSINKAVTDNSHQKLLESSQQHSASVSDGQKAATAAHTAAMVGAGQIPDLQIGIGKFITGTEQVAQDLYTGATNEFANNPRGWGLSFAEGAAIAGVAGLAVAGATAIGPEVAIGVGLAEGALAVGGAAVGLYELAAHAGGWAHDASVVSDPASHSSEQLAAAHAGLQQVGAGATDLAAAVTGSLFIAPFASMGINDMAWDATSKAEDIKFTSEVVDSAYGRTYAANLLKTGQNLFLTEKANTIGAPVMSAGFITPSLFPSSTTDQATSTKK